MSGLLNTLCSLQALLELLDLSHLLDRDGGLAAVESWSDSLSGGEQQRLGIARLLYHCPAYAIMDESTSALDIGLESRCMNLCREKGISCISVGHRATLLPFHDILLELDGKGGHRVLEVGGGPILILKSH